MVNEVMIQPDWLLEAKALLWPIYYPDINVNKFSSYLNDLNNVHCFTGGSFIAVCSSPHNAPINVKPAWGGGGWLGGRAWGGDLIVFVGPGVGHLTDPVLPGEGIFESFFARRRDKKLPTRTKKTETEHMFPAFTLHACAVRFEKIRKSWTPMRTSEGWVDFTVMSSNFVCFNVLVINWTS